MTVPEKTRYGVGRGLVLLGVNHYEYVLFGSILKVCEAFERFPVFNGVFDRGTFFGGCHDQKNYVTPDLWTQSKNTSYFLVSKLEKLNLRNCLVWWENIEKFSHQKKKKNTEYLSVFLCQRTKYLLIFQVVGYVVNRSVKK